MSTETNELKVKPQTLKVADHLEKAFKFGEGGVAAPLAPEVIEEAIKIIDPNMTMKQIADVDNVRNILTAGSGLGFGRASATHLAKHKKEDQTSFEVKLNKDTIGGVYRREKAVPDGNGGQKIKHGGLSMGYTAVGGENKGDLKKVREHLAASAAAAAAG